MGKASKRIPFELILIIIVSLVFTLFFGCLMYGSYKEKQVREKLLKSIDTLESEEYEVITYSEITSESTSLFTDKDMDILNKNESTYYTEIKYTDKQGNLKNIRDTQKVLVKYDKNISSPKLILKKVPEDKREDVVSEYVNPTLCIPLKNNNK